MSDPIFSYNGPVYVRPIGRGVSLKGEPYNGSLQLEDVLPEGDYLMKVQLFALEGDKKSDESAEGITAEDSQR